MKNYKLKITVTKEILKRSMMCGTANHESLGNTASNCAIALAVRDILPEASVEYDYIHPFNGAKLNHLIPVPLNAYEFINDFDGLSNEPEKRLDLPEITFEVEVPDEVIDRIDISKIYEGHPTLQLFESIDT